VPTAINADLARRSRLRAEGGHADLPFMDSVLLPGSREWQPEANGLYSVLDKGLTTALPLMQADRGTMHVIAEVNADPGFARHRDIEAASRLRAVQSTPLVGVCLMSPDTASNA
jgi:hypothetical protein